MRLQMRLKSPSLILCSVLVIATAANVAASNDGTGPVIRLFPTTVLEDIRETAQVAAEMESSLQEVIHRLDMQQQLYEESLCQGAEADPGCERIAKQLGSTYLDMLEVMTERLPDMERAVESTRLSLQKRLKKELGQRTTPTTLQEQLLGEEKQAAGQKRLALRGRSGVRLSDRFKQYYSLVATHQKGSPQSLAVLAADIYLDMEEASNLIAATQQEISRAALMEQLNQSFGTITPEMAAVVNGVKSILFGETIERGPIAAPPYMVGQTEFKSPLDM